MDKEFHCFIGINHKLNGIEGFPNELIPNIGHADAKHNPDWPAHIWEDTRLIKNDRTINNKDRFLKAAKRLYEKFPGIPLAFEFTKKKSDHWRCQIGASNDIN